MTLSPDEQLKFDEITAGLPTKGLVRRALVGRFIFKLALSFANSGMVTAFTFWPDLPLDWQTADIHPEIPENPQSPRRDGG